MRKTKKDFQEYLNELESPEDDKRSNGGRIPDNITKRKARPNNEINKL
jgi:hypothetical protein